MSDVKRNEHTLPTANWLREQINETLARYDIPSDVYDTDILIDALCVCAVDKAQFAIRARLAEVEAQLATARRDALEEALTCVPHHWTSGEACRNKIIALKDQTP